MISHRAPRWRPIEKPHGLSINIASPFACGLVAAVAPFEGAGGTHELVRGFLTSTPPVWNDRPKGLAGREWIFSAASTAHLNFTTAPFSVFVSLRITGTVRIANRFGGVGRYTYSSTSANRGWLLGGSVSSGNKFAWCRFADNATGHLYSTTARATNTDYALAGTTDGTTSRLYVEGAEESNTTNNPVPLSAATGLENKFGLQLGVYEYHEIYAAYIWNRLLDPEEIRELSIDPYALLVADPAPRSFIAMPALTEESGEPPRPVEEDTGAEEAAIVGATAGFTTFEIQDNAGVWTDFASRVTGAGEQRHLVRLGDISHESERQPGVYQTKTTTAEMDNRDGYFAFPTSSVATDPDGTTHAFSGFYRRKVRIGRRVTIPGVGSTWNPLAVMLIDDVRISSDSPTASLPLVPLGKLLQEAPADFVRDGEDWHRSKPIGWLVRALVERAIPDVAYETGSPPTRITLTTHDSSMQHSTLGPAPGWDGSVFLDLGYAVRAAVWDGADALYVGVETTPGSPFTTGASGNKGRLYKYTISSDLWALVPNGDYAAPIQYLALKSGVLFVITWRPSLAGTTQEKCVDANVYRHDPATGTVTTLVTSDQLWPCGWYYRKGNADLGSYWIGQTGIGNENDPIPVPYSSAIRTNTSGGYYVRYPTAYSAEDGSLAAAFDTVPAFPVSGNTLPWEASVARGSLHLKAASLSTPNMRVRAHVRHLSDTAKMGRTDARYLYWITYDGTNYKLNRIDTATAPYTRTSVTIPFSGVSDVMEERQILAWAVNDDASYLYCSCIDWNERTIGGTATSYLVRHAINNVTFGLSGESNRWSEGVAATPTQTRTLVDLVVYGSTPSSTYVSACYLDRRNVRGAPYGLFSLLDSTTPSFAIGAAGWPTSQAPLSGWTLYSGYWYFCDTASGVWYKRQADSVSPAVSVVSNGRPHVDGSPSLSSWPVAVSANPVRIFGFSAPSSPPWQHVTPSDHSKGIAWMFHLSTILTDRVDLADFNGLKVWDALTLLAQRAGDYEMGFSESGLFYFRPRSSVSPAGTLRAYPPHGRAGAFDYYPAKNLSLAPEYGSIVNVASVRPYVVRYAPPKATLERTIESEYNVRNRLVHTINQNGTRKQQIILSCVRRGAIGAGLADSAVATSRGPLYRAIPYRAIIDTALSVGYSSGSTTLYVGNITDVEAGDSLSIRDSGVRAVTAVNQTARTITIATGYASAYPLGSEVRVYKKGHATASDDPSGVTTVKATMTASTGDVTLRVASVARLSVGAIVRVGLEEMLITDVAAIVGSTEYNCTVVRAAQGSPLTAHAIDDVVLAYWAPREFDVVYPIEGSGISMAIARDDDATPAELTVLEGDRIVISCPGLVLEGQEAGLVVAMDSASIAKYQKKEGGVIDNRFVGYVYADAIAKRELTNKASPHLRGSAVAPLLDTITMGLGKQLWVEDRRLLKALTGSYATCQIVGYKYSERTGDAVYTLRSTETVR